MYLSGNKQMQKKNKIGWVVMVNRLVRTATYVWCEKLVKRKQQQQ